MSNTNKRTESTNNDTEAAGNLIDLAARTQQSVVQFWVDQLSNCKFDESAVDPFNLAPGYARVLADLFRNPAKLSDSQLAFYRDSAALWQQTMARMMGVEVDPVIEPQKGDYRFKDESWSSNAIFEHLKQAYLISARFLETALDGQDVLEDDEAEKLGFFTRQFIDAMSPTNFAPTNPTVIRETIASKGENLLRGWENFITDLQKSNGSFKVTMTDEDAFELGRNIATTPGQVVFQNRMFQLLQYEPTTKKAYKRPLLVIPPWINKYYIMDLQPKNSLIKWLVDQGHTVFVMSWVNPDETYADVAFDEYVNEGVYAAVEQVEKATGENRINAIGYCLGGTLLAVVLAHMAAAGDERIASATFLTTLVDFSEPGEITAFIDEVQVASLERKMQEKGYLEGSSMAGAFSMLRANDLIWMFAINNYLLGKDPLVFDLLYWNSDSTRMPARMHSYYLRNMYMQNLLVEPDALNIAGQPIDLSRIDIPVYFLSTHDDHIAPWRGTYKGAQVLSGPVRFVLGGSGHIAGVINPPSAMKYGYRTSAVQPAADGPEHWLENAESHDGSWWPDWQQWTCSLDQDQVPSRVVSKGPLKVIEPAPGSYVAQRV